MGLSSKFVGKVCLEAAAVVAVALDPVVVSLEFH